MTLDPRPIALVGLRASGKTTLGKLLAEKLGRTFVDLDEEVSREDAALRGTSVLRAAGEILASEGEPRFRDLEERALERVLSRAELLVLATGGGVVERAKNRLLLRTRARCLWLVVPVEELQRRMRADPTPRPPIVSKDALEEVALLAERRAPWFTDLAGADKVICCELSSDVDHLLQLLRAHGPTAAVEEPHAFD